MPAYPTRSLARADRGVAGLATIAQATGQLVAKPGLGWSTWRTKWSGVALGVPVYCTLANTGGRGEMEVDVENHR